MGRIRVNDVQPGCSQEELSRICQTGSRAPAPSPYRTNVTLLHQYSIFRTRLPAAGMPAANQFREPWPTFEQALPEEGQTPLMLAPRDIPGRGSNDGVAPHPQSLAGNWGQTVGARLFPPREPAQDLRWYLR